MFLKFHIKSIRLKSAMMKPVANLRAGGTMHLRSVFEVAILSLTLAVTTSQPVCAGSRSTTLLTRPTEPKESAMASQSQSHTLKVGDRVLARWSDGHMYPGTIKSVTDDTCEVLFDDGDVSRIHVTQVKPLEVRVGMRVSARLAGGPSFYPGIIGEKKDDETLLVEFDNGTKEWTSIKMLRIESTQSRLAPDLGLLRLPKGKSLQEWNWCAGDRVLARWLDFFWYPGTILNIIRPESADESAVYHILYDDGDQLLVPHLALMPLTVAKGDNVFVRPKTEPHRIYPPATVTAVKGEKMDVVFSDGKKESSIRVSRARFWRCPVKLEATAFEEGDRVLAYDCDGFTYPSDVLSIKDDAVIVQYLDGSERMVTPDMVTKFDLHVGDRVECRWKGDSAYYPGKITELVGDRVYISYDDGDKEWTTVRLLRLPEQKG